MKVALIASPFIPVPPNKYGWTERIIYFLIKWLKELGHEPILIWTGDSEVDCEIIPIVDKHIGFPEMIDQKYKQKELEKAIKLHTIEIIKENLWRFDILHSHWFDIKEFATFPHVNTLHWPILLDNIKFYENRKTLNFISISKNQQEAFPDLNYISTVYNWLDPDDFPFEENPDEYVCFLWRFDTEKNPHLAIKLAIKLWIKIKLWWKIDFQGYDYFEKEIRKYLDHPLVEFLWELDFADKIEVLKKSKCNLHPTWFREPFGLSVLEAAYCGTPTLAIQRWSMPELIEEDRTWILVEWFEEWYHCLENAFKMDRKYISERARMLFNYKNMTKGYIEAYDKVLSIQNHSL